MRTVLKVAIEPWQKRLTPRVSADEGSTSATGVLRAEWLPIAFAVALVSVLTWPAWRLVPGTSLDDGWRLGLSWAADLGLGWGRDIVFTYGPLGFTLDPMLPATGQVGLATALHGLGSAVVVAAVYLLARLQRGLDPSWSVACAVGLPVLVFSLPMLPSGLLVPVLVGSALLVALGSFPVLVVLALAAGVLGHQALVGAALAGGVALLCSIAARGPRGGLLFVTISAATWLGIWVATGQGLDDLVPYVQGVVEIAAGYARAMGQREQTFLWQALAALVVCALLLRAAWLTTRGYPQSRRLPVLGAVGWCLLVAGRESFTLHDFLHAGYFFSISIVAAVAILLARPRGEPARHALLAAAIALLAAWSWPFAILLLGVPIVLLALAILLAATAGPGWPQRILASMSAGLVILTFAVSFFRPLAPAAPLPLAARTIGALLDRSQADRLQADAREELIRAFKITPGVGVALAGMPALVDPWDIAALYAVGAVWSPLPTLQSYAGYTPELDRLNVESLATRPRQILRRTPYEAPVVPRTGAPPPRWHAWESPRYQRLVYCDYGVAFASGRWQILRRSALTRCADPLPAGSVQATAGMPVEVPRQDDHITLVTITPSVPLSASLSAFLVPETPPRVTYGPRTVRLPGTPAAMQLMLNAPVDHPAFRGLPRQPYGTITVDTDAQFTFELVPVVRGD